MDHNHKILDHFDVFTLVKTCLEMSDNKVPACFFNNPITWGQHITLVFDLFRVEVARNLETGRAIKMVKCFLLLAAVQMRAVIYDSVFGVDSWSKSDLFADVCKNIDSFAAKLVCQNAIAEDLHPISGVVLPAMLEATQKFFLNQNMSDPTEMVDWITNFDEDPRTMMERDENFRRIVVFSFMMGCEFNFVTVSKFFKDWGFLKYMQEFNFVDLVFGINMAEILGVD